MKNRLRLILATPLLGLLVTAAAAPSLGAERAAALPGNSWASIAKLPDMTGVYEIARAPGEARATPPSFTPKGLAEVQAHKAILAKGTVDDTTANCLPPGMPAIMTQPYPIQILFTPGEVTVVQEAYMQVRHIQIDGRKLPDDPDLTFNGTSIGRWEGDTLVVDTVGFAPETRFTDGVKHSDKERIQERFRLTSPDVLEIITSVEDPVFLTQPWVKSTRYARHRDWSIAEYICEQNNRNGVDETGKAIVRLGN